MRYNKGNRPDSVLDMGTGRRIRFICNLCFVKPSDAIYPGSGAKLPRKWRWTTERRARSLVDRPICGSCGREIGVRKPLKKSSEKRWYVNQYDWVRTYGGPEEGGWWYDRAWPIGSFGPFPTLKIAERFAGRLPALHSTCTVEFEPHPGRPSPAQRYE